MKPKDKIFVDAGQPAVLRYPGVCISCESLRVAIVEWRKLPASVQQGAAIFSADGAIYKRAHIPALYDRRLGPPDG